MGYNDRGSYSKNKGRRGNTNGYKKQSDNSDYRGGNGGGNHSKKNYGSKGNSTNSRNDFNKGKRPFNKNSADKPNNQKSFFKKYYKPNTFTKEERKEYLRRRYNITDKTMTIKLYVIHHEREMLLESSRYTFFHKIRNEKFNADQIIDIINKTVSKYIDDPDLIVKKVEIYMADTYHEDLKTISKVFISSMNGYDDGFLLEYKTVPTTPLKTEK